MSIFLLIISAGLFFVVVKVGHRVVGGVTFVYD